MKIVSCEAVAIFLALLIPLALSASPLQEEGCAHSPNWKSLDAAPKGAIYYVDRCGFGWASSQKDFDLWEKDIPGMEPTYAIVFDPKKHPDWLKWKYDLDTMADLPPWYDRATRIKILQYEIHEDGDTAVYFERRRDAKVNVLLSMFEEKARKSGEVAK